MRIKMIASFPAVMLFLLLVFYPLCFCHAEVAKGQGKKGETAIIDEHVVESNVNVHYTGKYCIVCHTQRPVKKGEKYLKFSGDFYKMCSCHNFERGTYVHPVDVVPSDEKRKRIPSNFPLVNGKITCVTCHNVFLQCGKNDFLKIGNKDFLRGGGTVRREQFCFNCHNVEKYKKLNPHNQLDEDGNIIAEKCLYCHEKKPDPARESFKDVTFIGDTVTLCYRCHGKWNHPANVNHLARPDEKILKKMKESEEFFHISLPLDQDGKVFCGTCHNPHDLGIIPLDRRGARGAGVRKKLRLKRQICLACHLVGSIPGW